MPHTVEQLNRFRLISFVEGISYIILLFVAMPLKYGFDMPEVVRVVGMAHGVLFMAYMVWAALAVVEQRWNWGMYGWLFLVSIIPFGTFYSEKHWLKPAV